VIRASQPTEVPTRRIGLAVLFTLILMPVVGEAQLPARFLLLGFSWTAIHVLLMISALARASAALLAVRIQETNTRGVPELLRTLAGELPKVVTVKRLPVPTPWAAFQPMLRNATARGRFHVGSVASAVSEPWGRWKIVNEFNPRVRRDCVDYGPLATVGSSS